MCPESVWKSKGFVSAVVALGDPESPLDGSGSTTKHVFRSRLHIGQTCIHVSILRIHIQCLLDPHVGGSVSLSVALRQFKNLLKRPFVNIYIYIESKEDNDHSK